MNPIGILGGTFDPIHFGHLRLAQEALDYLDLRLVRFIPTGDPWHRTTPGATAAQRLDMVRLACANQPRFVVDDCEVAAQAPGYTVDTLTQLRAALGEKQPLCLILGADAFLQLARWQRWQELFRLTHIVVAARPGFPQALWENQLPADLQQEWIARGTKDKADLGQAAGGRIMVIPITPLDISATRIRTELKQNKSPRYLLPDAVLDYISNKQLYIA